MTAEWFATRSTREVYRGWSTVRIDEVATPDGDTVEREVVEHSDAVAIVPLTDAGELLLLRQYRQPVGGFLLEIPAGTIDPDDPTLEHAARRELREELEHDASTLEHLTTIWNSAGWSDERTHVFLATGLRPSGPPDGFVADAEEAHMEVVALPLDAAVEAVADGSLSDAKSVVGILLTAARRLG